MEGRATSDHSRKPLTVTQRKRKRVTRLSGAEKQRRWRKRNRAAHKAQQRDYRRRKRRTQQESDARDAIARRCRDDQEVRERSAAANEATRKHNARQTEAFRLAKSAGLDMMAWLEQPEAENWADMKGELIVAERLSKEVAKVWEQLGYDPFSGNPIPQGKFKPEPVQEQRVLTLEEACTARRNAAYAERMRGLEELQNLTLSNGIILG